MSRGDLVTLDRRELARLLADLDGVRARVATALEGKAAPEPAIGPNMIDLRTASERFGIHRETLRKWCVGPSGIGQTDERGRWFIDALKARARASRRRR